MNCNIYSSYPLSLFPTSYPPILTAQHKKIFIIATIAFACLATLYASYRLLNKMQEYAKSHSSHLSEIDCQNTSKETMYCNRHIVNREFNENLLNEKETLTNLDGATEEGFFQDGKLNGEGSIVLFNGTYAKGIFENGELKKGTLFSSHPNYQLTEKGTFRNWKLHGQGEIICLTFTSTLFVIKGEFQKGKLEGYGQITHPNGIKEEGIFKNGRLQVK